jgi:hypothetical protein
MRRVFHRLIEGWNARRRRHKEALAASKRLGRDDAAWAELFRREDWSPPPVGHYGRCGHCDAELDRAASRCPQCGAEWRLNTRRSDLYRQAIVYSIALTVSVLMGYGSAVWLRIRFDAIRAGGAFVNPEMVDTLASFSWVFVGVLMMIAFTYAIERLAPTGHWRVRRVRSAEGDERRKRDARV